MQPEFSFLPSSTQPSDGDGLSAWREQIRRDKLELAKKAGLPIGYNVEVWLQGSVRLRGRLQLDEEILLHSAVDPGNLRLRLGRTTFGANELESCVRVED